MSRPRSEASSPYPDLESALHPRFAGADAVAPLARAWREHGPEDRIAHIEPLFAPGLAAEIAAFVPQLQLTPQWDHAFAQLSWRCLVAMPERFDPQYPACMYRLGHLVHHELPDLVSRIAGEHLVAAQARYIDVHVFRKGSFREGAPVDPAGHADDGSGQAPANALGFILGLTGARWPRAYGGHVEYPAMADETGHALGWDTLHLVPARARVRIPLVTHHVDGIAVMGALVPAREAEA